MRGKRNAFKVKNEEVRVKTAKPMPKLLYPYFRLLITHYRRENPAGCSAESACREVILHVVVGADARNRNIPVLQSTFKELPFVALP